jgi:FlaA1/EpsC-like NDP-sugar epimerase
MIGGDGVLCVLSVWFAYYLRLGEWRFFTEDVAKLAAGALLFWFPAAVLVGAYRQVFRYAGSGTFFALTKAVASMLVPMLLVFLVWQVPGVPRTLSVLQPIVFFLFLAGSRVFVHYAVLQVRIGSFSGKIRRILIYGAGNAGRNLANAIRHESGLELLGFIDDDPRKHGRRLDNHPIFHSAELEAIVRDQRVTDVYLAMPSLTRAARAAIVKELANQPVATKILPPMRAIIDGEVSVSDLRRIEITDLLGRAPVAPHPELLTRNITGKVVMVTGAGGSIGSELCIQIARLRPEKVVLVELSEFALYTIEGEVSRVRHEEGGGFEILPELCNVADLPSIQRVMHRHSPDTVFHAAAYKHVPLVEANVIGGTRNNVIGTWNLVRCAREAGVGNFILISTDKAVRPTNVMGATKRICEQILQAHAAEPEASGHTIFAMVRFGNVLGSSGSVVPLFTRQIREGGPITLTDRRVTRYFMTIPEAAELVIQAGAMARGGEVYVLDMGSSVRIADLARTMVKLSGLEVRDASNPNGDIEIVEVGLRAGEKLFEELLIGENPQATHHERIMQARERFIPLGELQEALEQLSVSLDRGNAQAVRQLIARLVPEYAPSVAEPGETDGIPLVRRMVNG